MTNERWGIEGGKGEGGTSHKTGGGASGGATACEPSENKQTYGDECRYRTGDGAGNVK